MHHLDFTDVRLATTLLQTITDLPIAHRLHFARSAVRLANVSNRSILPVAGAVIIVDFHPLSADVDDLSGPIAGQ